MKHKSGMANSAQDARNLIFALIGAFLATMGLVSPLQATDLKDIRIGEYAEYTRVVFEFDKPIVQEDQIAQSNSRMTVMFRETEPHLIRKIPFHRSKRINNLQIWIENNNLSIVLLFEFTIARYESFHMRDPFRMALDIYPLTGQVGDNKPSLIQTKQEPISDREIKTLITMNPSSQTSPSREQQAPQIAHPSIEPENTGQTFASKDKEIIPSTDLARQSSSSQFSNNDLVSSRIQPLNQNKALVVSSDQTEEAHKSPTSSLQYYLVIALVIITIVILGLLTMMLIARRRWTDEDKPAQLNNLLKQQDDRIASINERIKEQLKRYNEA